MSQVPPYEELVAVQARVIDELRAEVAELRVENAELKRRLGMDSTNSSKPPSSDPLERTRGRSACGQRIAGRVGRRAGGPLVAAGRVA